MIVGVWMSPVEIIAAAVAGQDGMQDGLWIGLKDLLHDIFMSMPTGGRETPAGRRYPCARTARVPDAESEMNPPALDIEPVKNHVAVVEFQRYSTDDVL
jgi:hypothetical protein